MSADRDLVVLVDRLASLERPGREAFDLCDEIVARWGASDAPGGNDAILMALSVKANMLGKTGRLADAVETYDQVLRRFEERGGAPIRLAHALFAKGYDLGELGRHAEAVAVFDAFLDEFGDNPPPGRLDLVIKARSLRALSLAELGRVDDALSARDEIADRYWGEEALRARREVAMSLAYKARLLGSQGHLDEAIAAHDQVLAFVGDADDADLRLRLVSSYLKKGSLLEKLGRTADALSVYEQAFDAFPESEGSDIDEAAAWIRRRIIALRSNDPADPTRSQSASSLRQPEPGARLDAKDNDAVEAELADLELMSLADDAAAALPRASALVRELATAGTGAQLLARARAMQAAALFAGGAMDEAMGIWRDTVASYGQSADPELRRYAALAQHNIANMLMCSGDMTGSEEAMDKLVSEFGEFAADAVQHEAQRAAALGKPLDATQAAGTAIATARILARCAPQRVAAVTDPAVTELRTEDRSPVRDELIAQLEQLHAEAARAS